LTPHPVPPRDPEPRGRAARQTRDRIARAALGLFTSRGYRETTTPLIAARAGVAEGTIYRHFPSKHELLNEVFRAAQRTVQEPWKASDPERPVRERLDAVASRWGTLAAREPDLIRLVFGDRYRGLLDGRSATAARDFENTIERAIAAGKAVGDIRSGPATLWASVWLRVIGLGLERIAAGAWGPDDPAFTLLRAAAWDAIRSVPLPQNANGTTINDPASDDSASGAPT
jgi:AcrR family transcriptional regulator